MKKKVGMIIVMAYVIKAYNVVTKTKGCPMKNAVITKTERGVYMAQGDDGKGNKLTTMMSEANALAAIKGGAKDNTAAKKAAPKAAAKVAAPAAVAKKPLLAKKK